MVAWGFTEPIRNEAGTGWSLTDIMETCGVLTAWRVLLSNEHSYFLMVSQNCTIVNISQGDDYTCSAFPELETCYTENRQ
jgi:hypothetical protein